MNELSKLAQKYGADKWGKHSYTPYYWDLFKYKRNDIKNVLEIGAGEGASLRMWRDFFPNADIWGADNQKNRLFQEGVICVLEADQTVVEDLRRLIEVVINDIELDIVIDDGSHNPQDQLFTCMTIMPMLEKRVTYIIEDVADETIFKYLERFYDCTMNKFSERYDDRVITIKHKNG